MEHNSLVVSSLPSTIPNHFQPALPQQFVPDHFQALLEVSLDRTQAILAGLLNCSRNGNFTLHHDDVVHSLNNLDELVGHMRQIVDLQQEVKHGR